MATETKQAFTPGPWTNSGRHIDAPKAGRFGKRICDLVAHDADARLIAAAPDLLAALAFCRSVLDTSGAFEMSERMAIEKANAAITKAGGEA